MTFTLEYHESVDYSSRRSIPALLAVFGAFLLPFILVSASPAQIGAGSSGSAHAASVGPPTGSVAPPTGSVAPPTGATHSGNFAHSSGISQNPGSFRNNNNNDGHHHPHRTANGTAYYPYVYGVPVPYVVDTGDAEAASDDDNNDDAEHQGGPTIFDRRGSGEDSYIPPSYTGPANASLAAEPDPEPPAPPTVLVFKDGHQVEVSNYAIVSPTLYDLTPGHPRKIALADLDLLATQKQNDDRGITFQLPPMPQAN